MLPGLMVNGRKQGLRPFSPVSLICKSCSVCELRGAFSKLRKAIFSLLLFLPVNSSASQFMLAFALCAASFLSVVKNFNLMVGSRN